MSKVYTQYIVPCVDEGIGILTGFMETVPTVCPNNNTHVIEESGIRETSKISEKIVTINQNNITCNNYFRTDFYSVPVAANSVTIKDVTYPYNINVYLATYIPTLANIGDTLDVVAVPDTTCGLLGTEIIVGATSLHLSPAYTIVNPGFALSITDNVNTNDLGEVISYNSTTNIITFSKPTTHNFAIGSPVKITIYRIKNCKFVADKKVTLGRTKMESSGLPANKKMRFIYTNNSETDKTFNFLLEIGY